MESKTGYKTNFSSCKTWNLIREEQPRCEWAKGVWCSQATPKYSFLAWIVMHNRLSTGNRMLKWNKNITPSCTLCQHPLETRNHLFFTCSYSAQIWDSLTRGIMKTQYTTDWNRITGIIMDSSLDFHTLFLVRYVSRRLFILCGGREMIGGMERHHPHQKNSQNSSIKPSATV